MQEIEDLHSRMRAFEKTVNAQKNLNIHKDNKFNKQFSVLLTEWNYLKVIVDRIENTDSNKATELKLDLKSLYVFGRVFVESLLYMSSLFVKSSAKINWEKVGPFVKTTKESLGSEPEEFKAFWSNNQQAITNLFETFRYRNHVLHEKDSNTEWTFAWPGRSNLDHVYVASVPWKEDTGKKEIKSLNARSLVQILTPETSLILNYLETLVSQRRG